MFRYSQEQKHKEKIHALMSNGYRFAVMVGERMSGKYRYKYEAERVNKRGTRIVELADLLEMPQTHATVHRTDGLTK